MALFALAAALLASVSARADDRPHADLDAVVGPVYAHRGTDTAAWGLPSFGGEARVREGRNGGVFAYTVVPTELSIAGLGHGPALHFFDLLYSYTAMADGAGALSFDVGPSVAAVERTFRDTTGAQQAVVDVPWHATFGVRAGLAIRGQISRFVIGFELGYRGGIPLGVSAPWEGAAFALLTLGGEITRR